VIRLDKLLSHCGYGSRKDVAKLIKSKLVSVNDEIVTKSDTKVDEVNDVIVVDGLIIDYVDKVYIMLNKPDGYVSATIDNVYPTVVDLIPEYAHKDLFVVGRLDVDTTGLLLLTNDGMWAHNITSPKKKVDKTYLVLIDGILSNEEAIQLEKGVVINDGYLTKPAKVKVLEVYEDTSLVEIVISEGKFHQVKNMFMVVNHQVLALKRVRIGGIQLDETLVEGDYRLLTDDEVAALAK